MASLNKELEKNSELRVEDVSYLREWLDKQPHLPALPDELLVLLLHSCYYHLEPTKVAIDRYCTLRARDPQLFYGIDPFKTNLADNRLVLGFAFTPTLTESREAVTIAHLGVTDADKYNFLDVLLSMHVIFDLYLHQHGTTNGLVIVVDLKGISMRHVQKVDLNLVMISTRYVSEALPFRLKGIHFVNLPPFMDVIMTLIRPVLTEYILGLVHFHNNIASLHSLVPAEVLPTDLGGSQGTLKSLAEQSLRNLQDNSDWLRSLPKLEVNESKRPAKESTNQWDTPLQGSFKKLEID